MGADALLSYYDRYWSPHICGREGMQGMKAWHLSHVIQILHYYYTVCVIVCTCCVAIAIGSEHGELHYSKVYSLAIE